jgi:hypothetical protein
VGLGTDRGSRHRESQQGGQGQIDGQHSYQVSGGCGRIPRQGGRR